MLVVCLLLLGVSSTLGWNGLASSPPMGWLSWQRFRCITDCKKYPDECISANLVKRTADLMATGGYLDAGYEYLGIDDCWMEKSRGPNGELVPDKTRFPDGMADLVEYVHSRGLKLGLYADYGTHTCAGYPGSLGHVEKDIQTFVDWEIDYIKLDGCNVSPKDMDEGYPAFGKLLMDSGRPILYSCSWPAYQEDNHILPNYSLIAENCNIWRNWNDIQDSWDSLVQVKNWFGDNQRRFYQYADIGSFNDPDMLLIGNFGLSVDQARVQMAVWAVMAAPLFMSVDLATIRPEFKEILLNKDIIAVNQDGMAQQGLRVWKSDKGNRAKLEIWNRELIDYSHAVAFVSHRQDGTPFAAKFNFNEMALLSADYEIHDLYKEEEVRHLKKNEDFEVRINPSGVKFYKFIRMPSDMEFKSENTVSVSSDVVANKVIDQS